MAKIIGDKLRAKMDALARAAALQRIEDAEYGLPGWNREEAMAPRPMFMHRVVERKVSSGHKVVYRLEYANG